MTSSRKESFGFKQVDSSEKRHLVGEVFSGVASKYDLMNDLMSGGMHRLWKREFCHHITDPSAKILDIASGSGDIVFNIIKKATKLGYKTDITASDINPDMLKLCQDKAIDNNILSGLEFAIADATTLPFSDNIFDYYTVSFGIRNMPKLPTVLAEAYRVLKPGGKFVCMEFSQVDSPMLGKLYEYYLMQIIPKIGKLAASNEEAYRYLAESICMFPSKQDFKTMIYQAGFRQINWQSFSFGAVAIHYGYKPTKEAI